MANDWQMPRRSDACAACERPFEIGDPLHAFLYELAEGYVRSDYCDACEPKADPPPVGSWRTTRRAPATRKPAFDAEGIFTLFEQLDGATEPGRRQLRFCLALLLWRKKTLRLDGSEIVDGVEHWRFTAVRGGTPHDVIRPELDDAEVERLSVQLEAVMAGEAAPELVEQLTGRGDTQDVASGSGGAADE